jgi:hypothetical protein
MTDVDRDWSPTRKPSQFLYDHFRLRRANDLSIRQASIAIDELKAAAIGSDG